MLAAPAWGSSRQAHIRTLETIPKVLLAVCPQSLLQCQPLSSCSQPLRNEEGGDFLEHWMVWDLG